MVAVLGQVGPHVSADVVVGVRLLEPRDELDGVVQQRDHVREGVPEEAGDPHRDVDPWTAQLGERDGPQAGHPP